MATNNTQNEENPKKTLTEQPLSEDPHPTDAPNNITPTVLQQSPPPTATDRSPEDSGDESKATIGDPTTVDSNNSGSVTDTLRKIQRAERFGMPVHLSEEEKRNSRAERFGTGSGLHGSDAIKKSEELKRKARAERFGIVQSVSVDKDAKKKARLARFAPVSNTDLREEDKKQARALRFSQSSSSVSQPNGKGNIKLKPTIAGKAGGVA